uniref:AP-3 complex subunit beta n=1 Tax=Setaria digitata TaxID=48799 RepID=A0A915PPW8_9BILA
MGSFGEGLTSPEVEIAEGGVIVDSKTRFADLKAMLDSSKDNLKMDAMKRIINLSGIFIVKLVAKGRDVSELFPAVVKNVAAKNLELKKLVFVYLVRYAEEQQDLALLSISTFQRALKDPNQLIRASALRVLSSIRVPMIAPVMLLAIRESVRDMSAYVRKVAAHAIPKLYSLEETLQAELIECIDYLLGDKRTLVLGSAVYAFEETCPDRFDLLHRHYRALCKAIVDVDEWGQVVMIGLLTRYARTQFVAPTEAVDPDLTLLLSSCRPLLQSRNYAVVMAVAQLFYHCAPSSQLSIISRALVRLLRGPREIQSVVLVNIATICATNPVLGRPNFAISNNMFEPFLKSFFIRPAEPKHIKLLKLQVLTSLVSETNVQLVLRELQTYVGMAEMADAAVEAIGQCAIRVNSVADSCLSGLVSLIASSNENVVSSAIVVLKRLLHTNPPLQLLTRVLRLIDSVKAPQARACVISLVATHVEKVPTLAPDVLRRMAKNFTREDEIVKLQTMNLAAKLWLTNRQECELLVRHVMQLARFDQNYDIRDRCRFFRNLLFSDNKLSSFANEIFITEKPSPTTQSTFKDREQFQLGSLSHFLNQRCRRYRDLPQFPEVAPDPSIRNTKELEEMQDMRVRQEVEEDGSEEEDFYSEDEESQEVEESATEEQESDENEIDGEEDMYNDEDNEEDESDEYKDQSITVAEPEKSGNLDLLLDLNFELTPMVASSCTVEPKLVKASFIPLMNHAIWPTGISIDICFPRETSPISSSMCAVLFRFTNSLETKSTEITASPKASLIFYAERKLLIKDQTLADNQVKVAELSPGENIIKKVYIDFGDSKRASEWVISAQDGNEVLVSIEAPMGEQIEPIMMTEEQFISGVSRLSGMNAHSGSLKESLKPEELYTVANCTSVAGSKIHFCAQTLSKKQQVLIALEAKQVHVHCENIVLGSLLCDDIVKKSFNAALKSYS